MDVALNGWKMMGNSIDWPSGGSPSGILDAETPGPAWRVGSNLQARWPEEVFFFDAWTL